MHQRVTLTNDGSTQKVLIVEPWATEYVLAPGETRIVELNGLDGGSCELIVQADGWVVCGWGGCTYVIRSEGGEELDRCDVEVPGPPHFGI